MIRILSFLGGVTVTSSVAYLTARELRNNSNQISSRLQQSQRTIQDIGKPKEFHPDVIEYTSRDNISETVKDLWNEEVRGTVGWVYRFMGYEDK